MKTQKVMGPELEKEMENWILHRSKGKRKIWRTILIMGMKFFFGVPEIFELWNKLRAREIVDLLIQTYEKRDFLIYWYWKGVYGIWSTNLFCVWLIYSKQVEGQGILRFADPDIWENRTYSCVDIEKAFMGLKYKSFSSLADLFKKHDELIRSIAALQESIPFGEKVMADFGTLKLC